MAELPDSHTPRPRRPRPAPEPVEVAVLYEDEWLAALAKPPGIVVHPTYRNWTGTMLNGLLWRYRGRAVEPRIVTRLDKDTSGVVIVALSADVHTLIQRDMVAGRVRKEYLALVQGQPAESSGTIDLPLARSADDRRRVVVRPDGQSCRTEYELLATTGSSSALRCVLLTGRTHQIRVHLSACGWPILGDRVYGDAGSADANVSGTRPTDASAEGMSGTRPTDPAGSAGAVVSGTRPMDPVGAARQALHAWRVSMPHPMSREALTIEAAVPDDMADLWLRVSGQDLGSGR